MFRQIMSAPAFLAKCIELPNHDELGAFVRPASRLAQLSAAIIVACPLVFSGPAIAAGAPPMTVPGQFNVSATGAATYTIPIAVPPGTAGMAPSISLSYSSASGEGIVGLGWSLSGFESINRCPRTLAQDSVHGGVNFNSNDRFCLDGQRLVAVSGAYGAPQTEYRTEIESFQKIVSYGSSGNGPTYFKVWTKSGQILEFGNTADSRVLAGDGNTVRSWSVNKISDLKGNYFAVTYNCTNPDAPNSCAQDTANGQIYPSRIDYTGNANAGLQPYNSVRFYYTSRQDVVPAYQAGSLSQTTVLLSDIKTYQGSSVVFDYQLNYRPGASTAHSRLTSVKLCDGSGACLVPTNFGWQGGTGEALSYTTLPLPGEPAASGDFNGDGLMDFITGGGNCYSQPPPSSVYFGQQDGNFAWPTYGACFRGAAMVAADINGDGLTDVFDPIYSGQFIGAHMWFGRISSQSLIDKGTMGPVSPHQGVLTGDYNGDGRTDVFVNGNQQQQYVLLSNGDSTFTPGSTFSDLYETSGSYPADYDGDGCTDLFTQGSTSAVTYFCSPAVSRILVPIWDATGNTYAGDFNGDGKTDVLYVPISGTPTLFLSTGISFASVALAVPSDWNKYHFTAGDFNGDGKSDLLLTGGGAGTTSQIWLSTGSGFVQGPTFSNTTLVPVVADWNNDGASDFSLGAVAYVSTFTPELMTSISNGIDATPTTTITYDRLNKNAPFYVKGTGATYPTQDMDSAYYVVSQVAASNGIGGTYTTGYSYAGAKVDLRGRGFLGFSSVTATDPQTGIVTTTNYCAGQTDGYCTGMASVGQIWSQTKTLSGVTLNSTTNTYADTNLGTGTDGVVRHFVALTQSVVSGNDMDGSVLPAMTANYTYDSYGNALTSNVSVSDGSSKNATNTYANDSTNWIVGRLTSTQVTSTVGSSVLTRTSCFQYDAGTGLLTREVIEPVSTSNCTYSSIGVQTDYGYDAYGHRTTTTVSGPDITTRSSSAGYDNQGQFQTSATNTLSQSESWTRDARFGLPMSHTDLNGLTTTWDYDTFGRMWRESRPDGNKTVFSYAYCSGSCVTYGATLATATPQNAGGSQNGPQTIAYYDALSRSLASDSQGFDGSWIRSSIQYDANGRLLQTSRPYFVSGGTSKWTVNSYDNLGRVTQASLPNGGSASYAYHGLTFSVTNDHNQTTTTVKNAQGLNAAVTDALNHTTNYVYDAFGNLRTVTDPSGNTITNLYDVRGNKTDSYDPDMGHWHYVYDVLGELSSQTDAKGQTTTLIYDLLGRPKSREENGQVSSWTYDLAAHGVGKLYEAKACTSAGCGTVISDRTFSYDGFGRPYTTVTTVDGTASTYTSTYDSTGRPATLAYPSGLTLQYVYTPLSYLSQIKDNSSGAALWTANGRDAEMHLAGQTFGNGVAQSNTYNPNTGFLQNLRATKLVNGDVAQFDYNFDTLGNLNYRSDNLSGVFEYACYDPLNRLYQYAVGPGSSVTSCTASTNNKTIGYDALGNITAKTGVGAYVYDPARPHAVSSITGTVNGAVNPSYTYDNNGNMTAGAGRGVSYTAFNMAAVITQGTTSVTLAYDDQHQRIKQTLVKNSTTTVTTYLNDPASGAMSEKVVSGSATTWREYLLADGKIVAQHTSTSGSSGSMWGTATWNAFNWSSGTAATSTWQYFVLDHLGSVAVVTDDSGAVVERNFYDAWGKRRNADGSDDTACSLTSQTTRGFTGHEQIDSECLINANARVYDQTIGRFMSPDSIIPDPFNGQSLNRYSYVMNRSLVVVDPSGHDGMDCGPSCDSTTVVGHGGFGGFSGGGGGGGAQIDQCWMGCPSSYRLLPPLPNYTPEFALDAPGSPLTKPGNDSLGRELHLYRLTVTRRYSDGTVTESFTYAMGYDNGDRTADVFVDPGEYSTIDSDTNTEVGGPAGRNPIIPVLHRALLGYLHRNGNSLTGTVRLSCQLRDYCGQITQELNAAFHAKYANGAELNIHFIPAQDGKFDLQIVRGTCVDGTAIACAAAYGSNTIYATGNYYGQSNIFNHEYGHILGFGHSSDSYNMMFPNPPYDSSSGAVWGLFPAYDRTRLNMGDATRLINEYGN